MRKAQGSKAAVFFAIATFLLPQVALASFGTETHSAFKNFVIYMLSFGVGSSSLAFMRVGYTYQWSDHPELTMTRLKHAVFGTMFIFGSIALAIAGAAIYTAKSLT